MRPFHLLTLALSFWLASCAAAPGGAAPAAQTGASGAQRTVILIGIDGFRADYLQRGVTPNLSRLAREGATARGGMQPSFPSITFPNFYTLATGMHPDRHGLVSNSMEDPALPGRTFKLSDRAEVMDRVWYEDGEPIWVTAERAGVRSGTLFWPGSEAPVRDVRPTYWLPFEQSLPTQGRVNMLLGWLTLPAAERPRFLTLYFDVVDTVGHRRGPDSPELNAALGEVDGAIGKLLEGLQARQIDADLVIVADHGMAAVSPQRVTMLDDVLDVSALRLIGGGPVAGVVPVAGREREVEAALLKPHPHMSCWRKAEIPARLAYGRHRRVPPILCVAKTGWLISTRATFNAAYASGGAHGYDNADLLMRALFIGHGPSFRAGATVAGAESVDIQPLLARLLGLRAPAGDGDPARFRSALTR
jgi:predicted AlkP superfamily pyrophosphatase or phosphodiesterase